MKFRGQWVVLLAVVLMFTVACSQTVYQQIVGYVNEFLPLAETVANLILATEAPGVVNQANAIEAQVNQDMNLIEAQASVINSQNYADKRATILNLAADAQQNLGQILIACHIQNQATVDKTKAFVALGNSVIQTIINSLPAPAASAQFPRLVGVYAMREQADAAAQAAVTKVKIDAVMHNYKHEYNKILSSKTGDARVDAVLGKTKRFKHFGLVAY